MDKTKKNKNIQNIKNNYYSFSSSYSFRDINGRSSEAMSKYENNNGKINQEKIKQYNDSKISIAQQRLNGKDRYLTNGKEVCKDEFDRQLSEISKQYNNNKSKDSGINTTDVVDFLNNPSDDFEKAFDKSFEDWLKNFKDFDNIFNSIGDNFLDFHKLNGRNHLTDSREEYLLEENQVLKKRINELEKIVNELKEESFFNKKPNNNKQLLNKTNVKLISK